MIFDKLPKLSRIRSIIINVHYFLSDAFLLRGKSNFRIISLIFIFLLLSICVFFRNTLLLDRILQMDGSVLWVVCQVYYPDCIHMCGLGFLLIKLLLIGE